MFYHTFIIYFCYFKTNILCIGSIASYPRPRFYKYVWGNKKNFSWRCCSLIHKQIQIHSQTLVLLSWNDRYRAASNWCGSGRKGYEWLEEERANKWTLRHLGALWYFEGLDTELDTVKKNHIFKMSNLNLTILSMLTRSFFPHYYKM